METRVLVLGAGFGGLELAAVLSAELGAEAEVTLIDRADSFVFGFSKLDLMFGRRGATEVRNPYSELHKPGVRILREEILAINPATRAVRTDAGAHEAEDAQLTLDGISITSASNSVSGAIDGVTVNLAAAGSTTLTVTRDNSTATDAIQGFVDAYNSYVKTVGTLSSYDATTGNAGILLGDTTLNSVQRQIASVLNTKVPGNGIGSLAALGITRSADGTLALDSAKLSSALDADPGAVQDLFSGANGYAKRLNTALDGFTDSDGLIAKRQQSLNDSLTSLNKQQSDLDARMTVYEKQLRDQYTALDTLMSQLNNTSSYLTGALAALEATYTKKD